MNYSSIWRICLCVVYSDRIRTTCNVVSHTFCAAITYSLCKNDLKKLDGLEMKMVIRDEDILTTVVLDSSKQPAYEYTALWPCLCQNALQTWKVKMVYDTISCLSYLIVLFFKMLYEVHMADYLPKDGSQENTTSLTFCMLLYFIIMVLWTYILCMLVPYP